MDNYVNYRQLGQYDNVETDEEEFDEEDKTMSPEAEVIRKASFYALETNNMLRGALNL